MITPPISPMLASVSALASVHPPSSTYHRPAVYADNSGKEGKISFHAFPYVRPIHLSFLCVCFAIVDNGHCTASLCFSLGCFLSFFVCVLCLFVCSSCLVCFPHLLFVHPSTALKRKTQQNALQDAVKDILRWHAEQTCYTRSSGFYENSAAFLLLFINNVNR